MPIVAEEYTFVIGVDTHAATHSLALVTAATGAIVDQAVFPNTPPGLDRALTTVVIVRMHIHAPTRAYVARRRAEGRTTKEIMRSLKRYITRQLYRTLAAAHPVPATP